MNIQKLLDLSALSLREDEYDAFVATVENLTAFLDEITTAELDDTQGAVVNTMYARDVNDQSQDFDALTNVTHDVIGHNIAIKEFLG